MKSRFLAESDARRKKITYKDIFEANNLFEKSERAYNQDWVSAHRFIDWDNLYLLSDREVMTRVIKFLNRWKSRIKKDYRAVEAIKNAHKNSIIYIKAIENESLWDLNYDKEFHINNDFYKLLEVIFIIFNRFRDIGYHIRETAATKLLHHINSKLFIMWDRKIAEAYKVKRTPYNYVYEFLPIMNEKINQVIDSYIQDLHINRNEAINALNSYRPYKTLIKLLDEYNWINYTFLAK